MTDHPRSEPADGATPTSSDAAGDEVVLDALLVVVGDRLRQAPDELTTRRHLAAIRAAQGSPAHTASAGSRPATRRHRTAGLVASLSSGVAAAAVALAMAGMLPAPVQRLAADSVARVGVELPGATRSDDASNPPSDTEPAPDSRTPSAIEPAPEPGPTSGTGAATTPRDAWTPARRAPATPPRSTSRPTPTPRLAPPGHEIRPEVDAPDSRPQPAPARPDPTAGSQAPGRPEGRLGTEAVRPHPAPPISRGPSAPGTASDGATGRGADPPGPPAGVTIPDGSAANRP